MREPISLPPISLPPEEAPPATSVTIATIARFMHVLFGKKYTCLKNSDFYQKLRYAPNFNQDKQLITDLQSIQTRLKKVQLLELLPKIEQELTTAEEEIKQGKTGKNL